MDKPAAASLDSANSGAFEKTLGVASLIFIVGVVLILDVPSFFSNDSSVSTLPPPPPHPPPPPPPQCTPPPSLAPATAKDVPTTPPPSLAHAASSSPLRNNSVGLALPSLPLLLRLPPLLPPLRSSPPPPSLDPPPPSVPLVVSWTRRARTYCSWEPGAGAHAIDAPGTPTPNAYTLEACQSRCLAVIHFACTAVSFSASDGHCFRYRGIVLELCTADDDRGYDLYVRSDPHVPPPPSPPPHPPRALLHPNRTNASSTAPPLGSAANLNARYRIGRNDASVGSDLFNAGLLIHQFDFMDDDDPNGRPWIPGLGWWHSDGRDSELVPTWPSGDRISATIINAAMTRRVAGERTRAPANLLCRFLTSRDSILGGAETPFNASTFTMSTTRPSRTAECPSSLTGSPGLSSHRSITHCYARTHTTLTASAASATRAGCRPLASPAAPSAIRQAVRRAGASL